MSHAHRDEHDLAEPIGDEAAPVVVTPPAPVVTNSDAERRAAERRKADGVPEQLTQHQFTGDVPEPDRGGSDTETRLVFGDADADEAAAPGKPAAVARRGPPPPRARHVEDEASWAAAPTLDALGVGSLGPLTRSWIHPPSGG